MTRLSSRGYCVDSTCRAARDLGFGAVLIADRPKPRVDQTAWGPTRRLISFPRTRSRPIDAEPIKEDKKQ